MADRPIVPSTPDQAAPPRPAATVVLLRDPVGSARGQGSSGMEVLMLRRHARSGFAANAWVFPGGVVDPADGGIPRACWEGIDPVALAPRLALGQTGTLAMYVAAARETFEEAGVLLAHHRDGRPVDVSTEDLAALRRDLNDRETAADWDGFLVGNGLTLDLSAMTYWLRWVTPIQEPKRYDTCFFLAHCPPDAHPEADTVETTEARWVNPTDALEDPDFKIIFPTRRTLEAMVGHDSPAALIDAAEGQDHIAPLQPHIIIGEDGRYTRIVMPEDDGYPHEVYA